MIRATTTLPDLSRLHVSGDVDRFHDPRIGAVLLATEPAFRQIPQRKLASLFAANRRRPFRYCHELMAEMQPDDLFIQAVLPSLGEAKAFVHEVLDELGLLAWSRCVDLAGRLDLFARLNEAKTLRCRFEVLSTDSCTRFHVDAVHARLICTYAGPGTQLRLPGATDIVQFPSGTALALKGSLFPEYGSLVQHRSPPIEGTGVKRFLFVVDDEREDSATI